jgi:8-oxo-dGTP diphosphatase
VKAIHVVALILENEKAEILVTKRPDHKHQGGLWEFPGGKLEVNESRLEGLKREIKEEVNFDLDGAHPLKCLTHDYGDIQIKLDVWYTKSTNPQVFANENQQMTWVSYQELQNLEMPAADKPIIEALFKQAQINPR